MAPQKRMMHLGAFVHETGQHVAAWRHPGAHARTGASFAEMVETAQLAERGKMDFLFLADSAAVSTAGSADQRGRMGKVVKFEPMTILSALAAMPVAEPPEDLLSKTLRRIEQSPLPRDQQMPFVDPGQLHA